jgi:hypothetical protein
MTTMAKSGAQVMSCPRPTLVQPHPPTSAAKPCTSHLGDPCRNTCGQPGHFRVQSSPNYQRLQSTPPQQHNHTMLFRSLALLASATAALAHNIQMKAHQRECFHESLHKDDKMTVTFQVGDREFGGSGNLEVDFWVRNWLYMHHSSWHHVGAGLVTCNAARAQRQLFASRREC